MITNVPPLLLSYLHFVKIIRLVFLCAVIQCNSLRGALPWIFCVWSTIGFCYLRTDAILCGRFRKLRRELHVSRVRTNRFREHRCHWPSSLQSHTSPQRRCQSTLSVGPIFYYCFDNVLMLYVCVRHLWTCLPRMWCYFVNFRPGSTHLRLTISSNHCIRHSTVKYFCCFNVALLGEYFSCCTYV